MFLRTVDLSNFSAHFRQTADLNASHLPRTALDLNQKIFQDEVGAGEHVFAPGGLVDLSTSRNATQP